MSPKTFIWKIAGAAGYGIKSAGQIFSLLASRSGFHIFGYTEYPSLIRGGHNTYQTVLAHTPVCSTSYRADMLVALNKESIDLHRAELAPDAIVLYDPHVVKVGKDEYGGVTLIPVPFHDVAKASGGTDQVINIVAIGASVGIMGFDIAILNRVLDTVFGKKGANVVALNHKAALGGYEYVRAHAPHTSVLPRFDRGNATTEKQMVLTGNDAMALGAIMAGCQFYAAYPMTPTTSLLHYFAEKADALGMVVKHAEDEISVINMTIGAAFAGARAMCGTAGGGFALMSEGVGLAGVAEVPIVVVVGQRPGPATGMPTWTSQGDLRFVMHASQDEFPRIVLAPGDAYEAFYLGAKAFNLAEKYQTPVIVLTDKYLGESHYSCLQFDCSAFEVDRGKLLSGDYQGTGYLRYEYADDGISRRGIPGQKGTLHLANSYEHGEFGYFTEEGVERKKMMNKRMKKLHTMQKDIEGPFCYGPDNAEITLVTWGSSKGPVRDAVDMLHAQGISVNMLHFHHIMPFPIDASMRLLKKAKRVACVEGNYLAQFVGVVREYTGIEIKHVFRKYDGRPFWPEEVVEFAKGLMVH